MPSAPTSTAQIVPSCSTVTGVRLRFVMPHIIIISAVLGEAAVEDNVGAGGDGKSAPAAAADLGGGGGGGWGRGRNRTRRLWRRGRSSGSGGGDAAALHAGKKHRLRRRRRIRGSGGGSPRGEDEVFTRGAMSSRVEEEEE
uniref:Uncharacterized protein n=1 Tax=Oryza glumipatula TaxID=40148 RepID=A0A0E0BRE7_9ORYZ